MLLTPDGFPRDAWALLSPRLTPSRQARMQAVAASRSSHIRLVLQDLHDVHNIAACLRSAEAMGILHVDVVDRKSRFLHSSASRGARAWLTLKRWDSEAECAASLKQQGYLLAGAYPSADAVPLHAVAIAQPLAIVFGNEHAGLAPAWQELLDLRFTIPMYGMVESFNISVAAAVSLYDLSTRARHSLGAAQYALSPDAQRDLLCSWVCRNNAHYQGELARLRLSET